METEVRFCKNCGDPLPPYPGHGPKREYCVKLTCNAQNRGKTTDFSITRLQYGWSKYGGGRKLLVKEQTPETWFCQACGHEQPKELVPYMFPELNEFFRICSRCHHMTIENVFRHLEELIASVRFHRD